MPVEIFVATPYAAFGDLIRTCLEDTGQYQVHLVTSGKEALESAQQGHYQLAILDSDLPDIPFPSLCNKILEQQKEIRLVIIPPENDMNHPSLGDINSHGYINRPFYVPDLLNVVSKLLGKRQGKTLDPVSDSSTNFEWERRTISLQAQFDQALKSTDAIAGIIGTYSANPENILLRTWAGNISAEVSAELVKIVLRYWNKEENTDLMRFIGLAEGKKDYLVYATRITGEHILITVYDSKTPLSQVRPQTKNIAQSIGDFPPSNFNQAPPTNEAAPAVTIPAAKPEKNQWVPEDIIDPLSESYSQTRTLVQPVDQHEDIEIEPIFQDETGSEIRSERDGEEGEVPNLSTLLESFPPPNPLPSLKKKRDLNSGHSTVTENLQSGWHNWQEDAEHPSILPITELPVADSSLSPFTEPNLEELLPETAAVDYFLTSETPINDLEDTRPNIITALTSIHQLEPVSPALSQINYTCVLVPRLPQHYLTGGLADHLAQWVHQLCLAYGWRLEGIAVRPEYLQWTVQVAPSISPGNLVRIIRQRSSVHIFNQYPRLSEQNPSGDFWASGYLIISGSQPPSAQLLREYIIQTRKRQGVIK